MELYYERRPGGGMADTRDLKSCAARRTGSSPVPDTKIKKIFYFVSVTELFLTGCLHFIQALIRCAHSVKSRPSLRNIKRFYFVYGRYH